MLSHYLINEALSLKIKEKGQVIITMSMTSSKELTQHNKKYQP